MRRRLTGLLLAAALLLTTGCASLLEREYVVSAVHSDTPEVAGSNEALRVENYQELVNALLYLVTERAEVGTLRFYDYDYETAEADLTAACAEVSQEDALGAYAVSYLQFDLSTIVSYLEADITITYRRTQEQVDSIQSVIGSTAIRTALSDGMAQFDEEIVLRLNYYSGDSNELMELLQRAYYETPSAALGMPQMEVEFYPRTGVQRIAEITLNYSGSEEILHYRQSRILEVADALVADSWTLQGNEVIYELCRQVLEQGGLAETGDTAYDALVIGGATSEGLALALALVCETRGISCAVVQGTVNGETHFWNVIETQDGYRHVDLTTLEDAMDETIFQSDRQAVEGDYSWNRDWVPLCGEQPVEDDDTLAIY